MLRLISLSLLLFIAEEAAAQYPSTGPQLNRNGYGGYATERVTYPDRTGLNSMYPYGVARNGLGGIASPADMTGTTNRNGTGGFLYVPGVGGYSGNRSGLANYPMTVTGVSQLPGPVTYFSFTNPTARETSVTSPLSFSLTNPTSTGSTGGGYYIIPSRR
jgi:hypothetical protein